MAAPVDSPPEGLASAAVVCFRNRTQLNIPDVRRSPLVNVGLKTSLPRAALFMPLLAQNEMLGVLEVHNDRKLGYFGYEEVLPKLRADLDRLIAERSAAATN